MKKLLAVAFAVLMASPAFAAIQNVKVSGDITTSWINDDSLDLGAQIGGVPEGDKYQNLFITQTRLRVDADLSDNVSTTVGLINERAWNGENSSDGLPTNYANDTNVQLYLASITLRELLYSPLTVTIGRQVFNYGNGMILGDGGPINAASGNLASIYADLNERTAYDGVKAILDYKPLTIDLIYFKNGQTLASLNGVYPTGIGGPIGGVNEQSSDVYGYNANYQLNDPMNTVIEQYFFARINGVGFNGVTGAKDNTLFVPGLRASTNPVKGLNVQGELAWELGQVPYGTEPSVGGAGEEAERRDAMMAQFLASYSLPVLDKYKPTVNGSFTYVSGDKNGGIDYDQDAVKSAKVYTGWDEFNTIQGAGTIYRALFNMSDEYILSAGASFNPLEDVTAGVTWTGLWLADAVGQYNAPGLLQPTGTGFGLTAGQVNNKGYWLGNETDLNLSYNYTEDVTFGLSVGWFVPGDVFSPNMHDTASQAIANVAVKF